MTHDTVKKKKVSIPYRIAPYLALGLMLAASVWVWRFWANAETTSARSHFDEYCEQISQDIKDRLNAYKMILQGGAGTFLASQEVTREEWRAYYEFRQVQTLYPGIQGLGFCQVIVPSELARHMESIRSEGFPEYTVWPAGERAIYTPIVFLEPSTTRNQRIFGYDLFSEQLPRVALERARDTATAAMSGRAHLVQEIDKNDQAGFLLYVPVFARGMSQTSVEERRASLKGYVYAPFRVKDLMRGIFAEVPQEVAFELYDGDKVSPEALLFTSRELRGGPDKEHRARFSSHTSLELYGHSWSLAFHSTPQFEALQVIHLPWIILATGLAISILVFLLMLSQQNTVAKAEALAAELTVNFRRSEQRFEQSTRHSRTFVWETDAEGRYTSVSAAVEDLLGYRPEELVGKKTIYDLHPEEGRDAFRIVAAEIIANKKSFSNLENRIQTKSGAIIWVNSSGIPLLDAEGNLIAYQGCGTDITARKRSERFEQKRSDILAFMASGTHSLDDTLLLIVKLIEDQNPKALASVLLLDDRGERLLLGVAPSLPDFYNQAVHGLRIGDGVGSCGTAAYTGRCVVVEDISAHPYWIDFRNLTQQANLRSCWSQPILSGDGRVLGTFAIYKREPCIPSQEELVQIESAAKLATLALLQQQSESDRIARQAAEQANQSKSVFLSNMSHEIRTPLNAILGFAQILERDASLTPNQTGMLHTITRSGRHLLGLINDILDMSKIESGRLELMPVDFFLQDLLNDLEMMFRSRAHAKQLQLLMERDDRLPHYVTADEGKLRQVLINLMGNAIKFTKTGGFVRVRVKTATGFSIGDANVTRLLFEIEDNGPGIAEADLDLIFEPFRQSAAGRDAGGTGLGLAVSRRIVEMMGGSLTVKSLVDKGSCFYLDTPVKLAEGAAPQEKAPTMRQVVGLEPGTGPFRILVADDQKDNRDLLSALLAPLGFEIRNAVNGQETLDAFEAWSPHAVLMDMHMPVLDGYEATRRIKATEQGRTIPVIAVTASAFDDAEREVLATGVDGYVRKPFRLEEILAMLKRCLGLRYVFAEGTEQATENADVQPLTHEDLAELPEELQQAMRQAVDEGDMAELQALIAQVGETDAEAARKLTDLADQYNYEILTQILAVQKEGEPDE